jgi:hypothetical protein
MRAVTFSRFGGAEVLEVMDLPEPKPGSAESWVTLVRRMGPPEAHDLSTGEETP